MKASVNFSNVFIKVCGLVLQNTLACLLAGGCESAYGGISLKAAKTALISLCVFLTPSNQLMKQKNNKETGVEKAGGG